MSLTFGKLAEFEPSKNDWTEYMEQMEQFFLANDIDNADKKKAILLSACGGKYFRYFAIYVLQINHQIVPSPSYWIT